MTAELAPEDSFAEWDSGSADAAGPLAEVTVVYVAGNGRSGSTLADNLLGQLDGFFAAGEVRYLWQRGLIENRLCACGVPFRDCPCWSGIVADAVRTPPVPAAQQVAAWQRRRIRVRRVPAILGATWLGRPPRHEEHDETLYRLYVAIRRRTGARVIVDSSKLPVYGRLLESLPGVRVVVLHMVRDPRATAFSWRRRRPLPDVTDGRLMQRQTALKSAVLWLLWNTVTELLWRRREGYVRVRYEDFVRAPARTLQPLLDLLGAGQLTLPMPTAATVTLAPTHSVAGNPSRFRTGTVELKPDTEWVTAMPWTARALVTAVTAPLLLRYGYRIRSTRGRGDA